MLTPEQIAALRDAAGQVADPITEYLISDIARRVAGAGQLTSTAAYQIYRAQQLGVSRREIEKQLQAILKKSNAEIKKLLTQSAEVGYNFDIKQFPAGAVSFASNQSVQQAVSAAVKLAQSDFTNLTQTLGLIDPFGKALPLQDAYRSCMDYAFEQVFTGAADYNAAIRQATKNLADKGVRTIDYESGVHTGLEAAVRRNIMGGLGLMQEQISQRNHDELGADGWEISAHAASAPDHEPWQGKQFAAKDYQALNDSLARRIGTLNCGHAAFPVILGVSQPQYTPEELQKFRDDNKKGVTYQGRHYTMYEATQKQRDIESAIRTQKRRILTDEAAGDADKLLTDRIRLTRLNDEYKRFSKAAGLRTQQERAQVAGFGNSQAAKAGSAYRNYLKNPQNYATLKAVSGGRITNQYGGPAREHAKRYYGLVRSMKTDVAMVAKNTGISEEEISRVKSFIFMEKHDLGGIEPEYFEPDFAMAQSWQRLIAGNAEPHDFTLLRHEIMENGLIESGLSQADAHVVTSQKYNYGKESDEYYAALKEHRNKQKDSGS